MSQFQQFSLPPPLLEALARMQFVTPTPIQSLAIPLALEGHDLIGCAQTGTGKTAAFAIPMVTKLLENPQGQALILAPTRELALQISEVLHQLTHMHAALLIGGLSMRSQLKALQQKPPIIVGTPGRIADHLRRKTLQLQRAGFVVLDEADRMLDMGFERQINEVLSYVPKERQTLLFSATMPERVKQMAKRYQKNPRYVSAGPQAKPADKIKHTIVQTSKQEKRNILVDELNTREGSVLIFVNTKHGTNRLFTYLESCGYKATRIHGGRTQGQRTEALAGFRAGKFRILVATDVAARGLDVPHIQHVINFDLPKDVDDYVHRIGRTARAGAEGQALCLLSSEDRNHWNKIAKVCNLEMWHGGGDSRREHSRPARGEQHSRPARGEQHSRPARGEQHSRPARGEQHSRPARGEQHSRPARGEQHSRPARGEQHSRPARGEQHSRPARGEQHSRPAGGEQHSRPAQGQGQPAKHGRKKFKRHFKKHRSHGPNQQKSW